MRFKRGFNLLELSFSLIIMSLIWNIFSLMVSDYDQAKKIKVTLERINIIEKSLANFAIENGVLPCPAEPMVASDSEKFGFMAFSGSSCNNSMQNDFLAKGAIAVRDLGLEDDYSFDGWGRKFNYIVLKKCSGAAQTNVAGLKTCSQPYNISITRKNGSISDNNIYVVFSNGENGYGGVDYYGMKKIESSNAEEKNNNLLTNMFYDSSPQSNFDDIVMGGDYQKILYLTSSLNSTSFSDSDLCQLVANLSTNIQEINQLCGQNLFCQQYFQILSKEIVRKCF